MTDRYAVIGHPIDHSKSPQIHAMFAAATGQDLRYEAIDGGLDVTSFQRTLAIFRANSGRGANVTLPFKLAALEAADRVSDDARLAGAANTLTLADDGIEAHNTDGIGLVRDIQTHLDMPLAGRHVLLLGAGGAARGVLLPLASAGAAAITVANRTAAKAEALVAHIQPHLANTSLHASGLHALSDQGPFDIVINATAASLGHAPLAVDGGIWSGTQLAYDMIYGLGMTPFLRQAQNASVAHLADGVGMLVEQAAESFFVWRGVRPDTAAVRRALSMPLA